MGPRALFPGEVEEPCEALRPNLGASDTPSIGSSARGAPNGGALAPLGTRPRQSTHASVQASNVLGTAYIWHDSQRTKASRGCTVVNDLSTLFYLSTLIGLKSVTFLWRHLVSRCFLQL